MNLKSIIPILALAAISIVACNTNKSKDGFTKLPNGLEIKFTEDKSGNKADSGSMAMINIVVKVNDSVVFDSKQMNGDKPVAQQIQPSRVAADLMAGFMQMSEGDKAIFRLPVDSVFPTNNPQSRPPFIKANDTMYYAVEMVSLKTVKQQEEEKTKKQAEEGTVLEKYLKDNNITTAKTPSGMYIIHKSEGSGATPENGKLVTMNYTGRLLDGTVFDTNEDPKFGHKEPFKFVIGQGQVIKGWDEGVATMKKGGKAKFIIPSSLAYGERDNPGNPNNPKGIPAFSTLEFDVTLVNIEDAPKQPQQGAIQVNPDGTVNK